MFVLQSLIVGIFVTLVAYYANYQRKRRRFNELAKLLPGRNGLPIIGYLHKFALRGYRDYLNIYAAIPGKDETLTKFWMGPVLMLMINSPENLQVVLNSPKCLKKAGVLYDMWVVTEGLVLSHGSVWKRHRKILNASFTLNALQKLIPMFQEKSMRSIQLLEKYVGKGSFDVYENVAACSLETLMKGNFNFDRDYQTAPHESELLMTMEK
jgi:cytochrome P450